MAENGKSGGNRRFPRSLAWVRVACAAYWPLLTVLLLVPDPAAWLGIKRLPSPPEWGTHFLFFAVLGTLVLASRPPLPRLLVALILIGYAVATEMLQSLAPPRTVEVSDMVENLLGVSVAYVIGWGCLKLFASGREN